MTPHVHVHPEARTTVIRRVRRPVVHVHRRRVPLPTDPPGASRIPPGPAAFVALGYQRAKWRPIAPDEVDDTPGQVLLATLGIVAFFLVVLAIVLLAGPLPA